MPGWFHIGGHKDNLHSLQATASITAQNFLAPADDLGYKVEYRHPYFFSSKDPKRTALAVSIFNARKLSGVFTPGMLWQ